MGEQLKNPPLIEAVCEFTFSEIEWDWAIPGMLYDRVKVEFPNRKEVRGVGLEILSGTPECAKPVFTSAPERIQFLSEKGETLVQIGQNKLSVNKKAPYQTWAEYTKSILSVYNVFSDIIGGFKLDRIGLRYINMMEINYGNSIKDFLVVFPSFPKPLEKSFAKFHQRYEISYNMEEDGVDGILIHQTGIVSPVESPQENRLVLDLDFLNHNIADVRASFVSERINYIHEIVETAFVESLNPDFYLTLRDAGER